jgi:hypothetical protein
MKKVFNWKNFRLIKELVMMYSNSDSLLSKKRIESGVAFIFALAMTIFYLYKKINTMDIWDFGYVLTTWLFIAGYTVNQLQKEKKMNMEAEKGNPSAPEQKQ